ncbi:unnamed protein product [Enterobius vermicularis]|uniref:Pecanex-like protein n=1 Tax=Enterobius vermicularis TaxID=51028 RepID=A0A0N4VD44_ENTVE|nr:unnamed protein product [Enterobius vermicularis]
MKYLTLCADLDILHSTNFLPTYSSVLLVNGMVSALKALPGNIELAKKARLLNCLTENDKKPAVINNRYDDETFESRSLSVDASESEEGSLRYFRNKVAVSSSSSSRDLSKEPDPVAHRVLQEKQLDTSKRSNTAILKYPAENYVGTRLTEQDISQLWFPTYNRNVPIATCSTDRLRDDELKVKEADSLAFENDAPNELRNGNCENYVCFCCKKRYKLDDLFVLDKRQTESLDPGKSVRSKGVQADMQKTTQESSVQCSLIGETFLFNVDERLSDPDLNTSEKSDELPSSPPPIVNESKKVMSFGDYKKNAIKRRSDGAIYELDTKSGWMPSQIVSENKKDYMIVQYDKCDRVFCAVTPIKRRRETRQRHDMDLKGKSRVIPLEPVEEGLFLEDPRIRNASECQLGSLLPQ